MSLRDLHNSINVKRAISPAAATIDNTAWTTQILDRAGYGVAELLIATGSLADADATFTVTIAESDASNMSGSNAVAAADLLGTTTLASFDFSADDKVFKLGYIGSKRYIQATITPANNTGNAFVAAIWVLGAPSVMPTANPPA